MLGAGATDARLLAQATDALLVVEHFLGTFGPDPLADPDGFESALHERLLAVVPVRLRERGHRQRQLAVERPEALPALFDGLAEPVEHLTGQLFSLLLGG